MVRDEYNHSRPVSALIRDWLLHNKAGGGGGILKTVTGNPISVSDALAAPIQSLTVAMSPIQEGSGDPSPDNIRPITGRDSVTVWREVAYDPSAEPVLVVQLGQTVYGGTVDVTTGTMTVTHAIVDLGNTNWVVPSNTATPFRTQAVSTLPMFDGKIPKYNENFICTMYSSAGLKAYNNVPDGAIAFTNGSVDNPGNNMIRIHDSSKVGMTAAEFKTYISGTMLCYELLEPFTVQLTPASLSTLRGDNNVWSDADDISMTYKAASE